ncbi:MAG TPA: glycine cleavage system protein GcvH [Thermoleophilia bacterium]|nr:glycine cleavage system protein GcvH [Thermoleophilia bacterium]
MYPEDLRYSKEHEWVKVGGDRGRVGITDYAQEELGDVVNVELPPIGRTVRQFNPFGVVESVKAVQDLYAPVSGTVVAVNEKLRDTPEVINQAPYGEGWMIQVKLENPAELDNLMSAAEYQGFLQTKG